MTEQAQVHIDWNGKKMRVAVTGRLLLFNARDIRLRIIGALDDETRLLEIDLAATEDVDSSGLGMLVAVRRTMQSRGGDLLLLNVPERVQHILSLTGLESYFALTPSKKAE